MKPIEQNIMKSTFLTDSIYLHSPVLFLANRFNSSTGVKDTEDTEVQLYIFFLYLSSLASVGFSIFMFCVQL